ncbi:MAG TPA: hypothetical protein VFP84_03085 [Kofleriaceae bacterium]|nr:hypothetical protein [Kofleriaceae bacterium]
MFAASASGLAGCHSGDDDDAGGATDPGSVQTCTGIGCAVVDCAAQGKPSTTVSGTVLAPNGTLPLYGVDVYVPMSDPGPFTAGVQCGNCANGLPGGAFAQALTDENGHFVLSDVPATGNVPIVIQVGKWRKQITVPAVPACRDTALDAAATTLPRNHTEGDMPEIAISTGSADALECLVRKLGVDDREITTDAQPGKVHLYNGNGASTFATGFAGGTGSFPAATTLWNSLDKLSNYDIVLFSCEGGQHPETKSQAAMQAVHDYADKGGRVFLSHWHNIWVGGDKDDAQHGLADWQQIADFDYGAAQNETVQATFIDEDHNPKGRAFADWLGNVGGSTVRGEIMVNDPRYTCQAVDPDKAQRWVYVDPARSVPLGKTGVQDMVFTTPQSEHELDRCGKVVFSDMHVSAGSTSKPGTPYPGGCSSDPLTPQEKALAFMFFDISSCVGVLQ